MDELEQALGSVLSDPEKLGQISRLAGELFGGGEGETKDAAPPRQNVPNLGALKGLLGGLGGPDGGGGQGGDKAALLTALSPFLGEERRRKLQKAMRLAKMARMAGAAMKTFGGEDDGL